MIGIAGPLGDSLTLVHMLVSIGGLFTLLVIAFWLWAVYDSLTSDADRVRALPKGIWVIIVLLIIPFALGAIGWVVFGRPRAGSMSGAHPRDNLGSGAGPTLGSAFGRGTGPFGSSRKRQPDRPIGPDDDPDFLKGL
jgi:hypothetical protein